jgi:hypothetical protein
VTDSRSLFDLLTAGAWFVLACVGIVLRIKRLIRLHRIRLIEPIHPSDADYLASVKRSTLLRLGVKIVFLLGSLVALFGLPLFELWRIGVVLALAFMLMETLSVDRVRERLARAGATV